MKIAISTIIDYNNYGNRLQNYALQKILEEEYNAEVLTIKNLTSIPKINKKERMIKSIEDGSALKKILNRLVRLKKNEREITLKRNNSFKNFTQKYINETVEINQNTTDFSCFTDITTFIIGSDQVWNYEFDRFSNLDFIPYSQNNQRVISYAASFGVSEIPNKMKKIYQDGLMNLNAISVRESSAVDIVTELVSVDAQLVLDPTMLISVNDWQNLINASQMMLNGEKYILTYFLGNPTDEEKSYITQYAKRNDFKIYRLGDPTDVRCWIAGPDDFVKLIYHAEAVFTDSFHACVFSIIFEKYFEVFDRNSNLKSMNSRIDTLLSKFNLIDQKYIKNRNVTKIDYHSVSQILHNEKNLSFAFLNKQMNRN